MKLVPNVISRFGHRSVLKLNASSPTLLVVSGVIGMGATAILAARATRKIDPVIEGHQKARAEVGIVTSFSTVEDIRYHNRQVARIYLETGLELTKLYGPTLILGTTSAVSILAGHRILSARHAATVAAYSGLVDQFASYRKRVARTLGEEFEKQIYEGAHGEYVEDPDHKGEYKLKPVFDPDAELSYLRPWFDERNVNWNPDPVANYLFLKGQQAHFNRMLEIRGHVFLNDIYDQLRMERTSEGQVMGWLYNSKDGDKYIDFGFMTSDDPAVVAFRNGLEQNVRLNFNVDPIAIWQSI